MQRKCVICGIDIDEGVAVCPKCGMKNPTDLPEFQTISKPTVPPKKKVKVLPFILAGAVLVVVAAAFVLLHMFGNTPDASSEQPSVFEILIDNTMAHWNGDSDKMEMLAPPEFWEYGAQKINCTKDEYIVSEKKYYALQHKVNNPNGDITRTGEIISIDETSEEKLQKIAETLFNRYGILENSVTAGKELTVQLGIITPDKTKILPDVTLSAVEINGTWYLVSCSEFEDTFIVSFFIW